MVAAPDVYEPAETESMSETVVRGISDSLGIDPMEMDVCLYDVVDPDALDALFEPSGSAFAGHVAFSVAGKRVVVDGSRTVYVGPDGPQSTREPETPEGQMFRDPATAWQTAVEEL